MDLPENNFMKQWIIKILLLAGYSVPYVFLAMNGDAEYGTMLFYGIMVLSLSVLCFLGNKTNHIFIMVFGNLCSALSSYCFLLHYQTEKWSWYFKPFTAGQLLVLITVVALVIQLLCSGKLPHVCFCKPQD